MTRHSSSAKIGRAKIRDVHTILACFREINRKAERAAQKVTPSLQKQTEKKAAAIDPMSRYPKGSHDLAASAGPASVWVRGFRIACICGK
ncbi:hypothetical protein GCM10011405_23140 [Rufibacter glacialis]|nr:hypothetical protein GCM10011405_23140 [Rufibacter glacialis]